MTNLKRRGWSPAPSRELALRLMLALALLPASALAQDKIAVAQRLFSEGRARLKAHDYEKACALLAQSAELDAKVGTLASLGQCEEGRGLLANAWAAWQRAVYAAQSSNDRRLEAVKGDFERVDKRVPKIAINAPSPPPELKVIVDGEISLQAASLGIPLPVNVGSHTLRAVAPGKRAWSSQIDVSAEGQQMTVTIPRLADEIQTASAEAPAPLEATPAPPPRDAGPPAATGSASPLRAVGVIVGVVGLAALGGASYAWWGYAIPHNRSSYSDGCNGNICVGQGAADRKNAVIAGNVATGLGIGGGVLVATGVVLWVIAPRPSNRSPAGYVVPIPWVDAQTAGVLATGTF